MDVAIVNDGLTMMERMKRTRVPTMIEYLDTEWDEGDGLPGPAYRRRYGVDPGGPEAMGETQEEWDARMKRNNARYRAEMRRQHSKRTRVRQYVERLTGWHWADGAWLRNQPWIMFSQEIDIEELRRRYPDIPQYEVCLPPMAPGALGQKLCIYAPLEIEVDPSVFYCADRLRALCEIMTGVEPTKKEVDPNG